MRLIAGQRNGLPLPQRLLYIKPDLRRFHEAYI
jgi:hypothetical protein